MGRLKMAPALLALMTLICLPVKVEGQQANMVQSQTFWNLSQDEKILNIAQFLAGNTEMTKKILAIAKSLLWMEQGTNGNPLGDSLMPFILDALPDVFNSSAFKLAFGISFDEIGRVKIDDVTKQQLFKLTQQKMAPYKLPDFSAPFNETLQKLTMNYMMNNANWPRAVNRFLTYFSARNILYEQDPTHPSVNSQCYNDTMDFLDAIVGAKIHSQDPNQVDPEHFTWALKMLDSVGKPAAGIVKGGVHLLGSYEVCNSVHAYLPNNSSILLGRRPHSYVTDYDARYCRVSFDLPDYVVQSFGVNTRGMALRLHWDTCFPETCTRKDVAAIFRLGMLQKYNLSAQAFCTEDDHLDTDASAIAAIVILAILVGAVVISTLIEAGTIFYNNNFLVPDFPARSGIEDSHNLKEVATTEPVVYHNAGFQSEGKDNKLESPMPEKFSDSKEAGVPATYVHHQEVSTDFKGGMDNSTVQSGNNNSTGQQERNSPPPSYTDEAPQGGKKNLVRVPRLVKAFSVLTNMPKMLSGKKNPKAIHCLHGIRFFSMLWVVLGHTYNYGLVSAHDNPTSVNMVDADAMFRRFTFQGVLAGAYAVDTFFLLSGFLVCYLTMKDLAKKKSGISYWIMFYVHRYWRLTPLYMIVLMTFTCLISYMGKGPLWPEQIKTAVSCKKNWWTNLVYVNNLVKVDDMCMGWTWYLSNDMQFYWISPILLLVLSFAAPFGLVLIVGLMCGGIASALYEEHRVGGDILALLENPRYWNDVYVVPWTRVSPYLVGMLLGYIIFKVKKTTLRMGTAVCGWLLTWGVGLFLVYITYSKRKTGGEWTRWEDSLYESFGRPLWATCVAWIIFACHNNRGGFINSILSWQGFLPASRLTYAAYLVHPLVMMVHVFNKRNLIYVDDNDMMYLYLGHAVLAFIAAFFFSLVAEAPALALEKLVFRLH